MPTGKPETTTLSVTETRAQLSRLLNEVSRGETRVIVEKNGVPVAAVVTARDLERLQIFEAEIQRNLELMERIREPFKDVPPEELEAEVARAIQEVREEARAERVSQGLHDPGRARL